MKILHNDWCILKTSIEVFYWFKSIKYQHQQMNIVTSDGITGPYHAVIGLTFEFHECNIYCWLHCAMPLQLMDRLRTTGFSGAIRTVGSKNIKYNPQIFMKYPNKMYFSISKAKANQLSPLSRKLFQTNIKISRIFCVGMQKQFWHYRQTAATPLQILTWSVTWKYLINW